MTNRSYVVCPYASFHFSNASSITRILLNSLSLPLIVAIRCWDVNPSVSPKMRRMRSIQARTRFHNVSTMRSSSISEKSSPHGLIFCEPLFQGHDGICKVTQLFLFARYSVFRLSHFSKSDKVHCPFTYASNTSHKLLASEPTIGNHILRM